MYQQRSYETFQKNLGQLGMQIDSSSRLTLEKEKLHWLNTPEENYQLKFLTKSIGELTNKTYVQRPEKQRLQIRHLRQTFP